MRRMFMLTTMLLIILTGCSSEQKSVYSTTGTVEAYKVDMRASAPGKLIYVNIPEGDHISSGRLLAVIDTTSLALQRQQAEIRVQGIQPQLQSLINHKAQLKTKLAYLQKQYDRISQLVKSQGMPQSDLDEIEMQRNTAQQQLDNIPHQRESLINQREQLKAQIDLLDYQITESEIHSPNSGVILNRYVEPGEQVQPGHLLGTIGLVDTVWITMYIPETMLSKVKLGDQITIQPDGIAQTLSGKVEWISAEAEFTPKTVYTEDNRTSLSYGVRVSVPNPKGLLKIGMPVTLSFPVAAADQS